MGFEGCRGVWPSRITITHHHHAPRAGTRRLGCSAGRCPPQWLAAMLESIIPLELRQLAHHRCRGLFAFGNPVEPSLSAHRTGPHQSSVSRWIAIGTETSTRRSEPRAMLSCQIEARVARPPASNRAVTVTVSSMPGSGPGQTQRTHRGDGATDESEHVDVVDAVFEQRARSAPGDVTAPREP